MSKTISELLSQASSIKRATSPGANTAAIVGGLFEDIINYLANINSTPATETVNGQSLRDYVVSEINRLTDRDNQLEGRIEGGIDDYLELFDSIELNPETRWLTVKGNSIRIPATEGETITQTRPNISFPDNHLTVYNNNFTGFSLSNPHNVEVTYSSSRPGVATVDSNGTVTIHEDGQTEISATSVATPWFYSQTARYVLTVYLQSQPQTPSLSEINTIEEGKYYYYKGTITDSFGASSIRNPLFMSVDSIEFHLLTGTESGDSSYLCYNESTGTVSGSAVFSEGYEEFVGEIISTVMAAANHYNNVEFEATSVTDLGTSFSEIKVDGYILPQDSGSGSGSGGSSLNPNSKLEISENLSSADSGYYYISDNNNYVVYLNFDACVVNIAVTDTGWLVKYNAFMRKLMHSDTVVNSNTISTLSSSVASYISSHGKNMVSSEKKVVLSSEQMERISPNGYLEINS